MVTAAPAPNFLAIGHVTWDHTPWGTLPGGAAFYAARTAQRLGRRVAVLTSAGPDWDPADHLPGVATVVVPSQATTIFENRYEGGRRRSWLRARASDLFPAALPAAWHACPVVLLCPLAGEVDPAFATMFPRALVGLAAQGWLRSFDASGLVTPTPWAEELPLAQACVFSLEDVGGDEGFIRHCAARFPFLVVTEGPRGARLWARGQWSHVPPFPANERDPTGAGDVFAAAFLIGLARRLGPLRAAQLASAVAACSVEGIGASAIPGRRRLLRRLGQGPLVS